tara:strand:+ start:22967 stop:24124 length:1158 start_codon:yes stop_codon:yes gene_type:complete
MLRSESEAELAEMIRAAHAPLAIRGGATRGLPLPGEALDTTGLHGIRLYEPGALTLVVGAGTPIKEIDTILAEKDQRMAFEPMDHRALMATQGEPTIGGVTAANISGPRRIQVGAARDHMLGVRFVTGTGDIVKNGGRVMKNVTGYDLVKLMAGSFGTLGVLSELSLKVQAIPEAEATLILRGQDMRSAVADLTRAMGTAFDISGAAWLDASASDGGGERRIRVEGMAGSVAYRSERLADLLGADHVATGNQSAVLWQQVRDVTPFANRPGTVWKVSTRPSIAADFCGALTSRGIAHSVIADWSGGLLWLCLDAEADPQDAGAAAIRQELARYGGHATLIRANPDIRAMAATFQPQPPALERIAAGLREKFDPRQILNPGLMAPL